MSVDFNKERGNFSMVIVGVGKTNGCHAIACAATTNGCSTNIYEEPTHYPKFSYFYHIIMMI